MHKARISHNEEWIIRPYCWQAYGVYSETGTWFATVGRGSNEWTARQDAMRRTHPLGPVITYFEPIVPRPRPEKDRRRFRRDNPHLV